MSPSDLESLPPDIERLLESEKSRPDPPSDMRSRVLERIGADLFDVVPPAAPPGVTGPPASAAPAAIAPSLLRRLPMAVSLLAVGGVGGAALHATLGNPAPAPVAVVSPSVAVPAPPAPAPGTTAPPIVAPPMNVERREPPSSRRHVTAAPLPSSAAVPAPPALNERERQRERDAALAAERALLEQARTALARGKPGDALGVLYRHERDFARGQLVEERQALEILCLAADRQTAAARGLAAKFKQTFPKSMLTRAIDDALATAP